MGKDLNISRLCDAYGALLTEHKREVIRMYYDDDLSLAEIAENTGVTRQAARCSIKQAESQLRDYEDKLGLVARQDALEAKLKGLKTALDADISAAKKALDELMAQI